jgi:hypothetical protein
LGDDLVIFDHDVAKRYLEMAALLGVEINLTKSIQSKSRASFEFAKRMVYEGVNVSAISFKQLISGTSLAARLNNVLYFAKSGLLRSVTVLSHLLSR